MANVENSVSDQDDRPVLTQDGVDYILAPHADSVWIEVDGVAVWVRRDERGGVSVELYPSGDEDASEAIDVAHAALGSVRQ